MCAVLLPDLWPSVQQCNCLILNAQHVKTADLYEALKLLARLAKLKWKQRCYVSVQSGLLPVFRHAFVVTETIKEVWKWLAHMHPDVSVLEEMERNAAPGLLNVKDHRTMAGRRGQFRAGVEWQKGAARPTRPRCCPFEWQGCHGDQDASAWGRRPVAEDLPGWRFLGVWVKE